ncbi:MAG: hypothetical protein OXH06_17695 [Gemmatimonadetes bacterium]|nr:hypothetical protein [Gemmatimonadota bacterium]MDE3257279.1 hypothetical protein [Gemmatimonadota bacterium]
MLTQVSSSVYSWSEIHGAARNEPYPWNSFVIRTNHGDGLVLVDPLPLPAEDAREIEVLGKPAHILLTCEYHLRESEAFRDRWGCDIRIHADGSDYTKVMIDETLLDGDLLWDRIEVIHIPDAYHTDEVAFLVHGDGNTMIVGDAVCGGRRDRGIPDGEIWINAPEYIVAEMSSARDSLRKLAGHPFERMVFGHGSPILHDASDRFRAFLEDDEAWAKLESEKAERTNPSSLEFIREMKARKSRGG